MSARKKLIAVVAGGEMAVSAAALVAPAVFPLCSDKDSHTYMAVIGICAVVIAAAFLSIISSEMETPRMLSVITAIGGILIILYPSFLIGVCNNPMMACTYGDLPVWRLCGGAILLLSIIIFFAARKDEVDA